MKRYDCLKIIADQMKGDELFLLDLLNVSAEWYALNDHEGNLYNMQMGIPIAVGMGLAMALPKRQVIACQGDGSLLLNLGILVELGQNRPRNLICIIFDNECYEAVGGHPTPTRIANLAGLAREAGLSQALTVSTLVEFEMAFRKALHVDELGFIVCKIEPGTEKGKEVKSFALYGEFESTCRFVRYIERTEGITIARPNRSLIEQEWL